MDRIRAAPQAEARSTGLPSQFDWTFNFDAGWGNFGFANSLFNNPKEPGVDENLSDQWFEGYVKPALSGTYTLASTSEIYGKLSAVGERTYGSVPAAFGEDVSSFGPEDLYIGWRSGKSLDDWARTRWTSRSADAQYRLGHGFLLYDGGAEGGSRGGYWTNARKAFEFAAIGALQARAHTAELFYLDKDELPESDSGTRLWGANYELALGEQSTFGATYMKFFADDGVQAGTRRAERVQPARLHGADPELPDLSFEFEYALEDNGDALDSNAWTLQAAYQLSEVAWKPKLSYRYAFFEGDDPATLANENFDPLFLGFYDWGQWWQGEIAGEYFLSNSNLISHLFRVHVDAERRPSAPACCSSSSSSIEPASYAPGVTEDDPGVRDQLVHGLEDQQELHRQLRRGLRRSGKAVQQAFDRTKNFTYGMVYLAYSF